MVNVDSKGRIVLPKEVRERHGITPGAEVELREEDRRAVIEPEDDPEDILDRMERLVAETVPDESETRPLDDAEPVAQKHGEAVRRGAKESGERDGDE